MQVIILNINDFTSEQIEAIKKTNDIYFNADMCDNYDITLREKQSALNNLKEIIPNMISFYSNYYSYDLIKIKVEI